MAGPYVVGVNTPLGSELSPADQGGDDALDSDANPTTGLTPTITLAPAIGDVSINTINNTVDAGISPSYGSIGNYVWEDSNNDGLQTGETPLSGVKVYLLDAVGTILDSTTTNASGAYLFDSLVSGTYSVQFVAPAGTKLSMANQGADDMIDSDADALTGISAAISINATLPAGDPGRDNLTVDAGIVPMGSIGNFVFKDVDVDGQQTLGETGIANVKVYLLDGSSNKIDSVLTDIDGLYLFDSLLSGTYSVQFNAPLGSTFTSTNVGSDDTDSDAGLNGITHSITLAPIIGGTGLETVNLTLDAGIIVITPDTVTVTPPCATCPTPPVCATADNIPVNTTTTYSMCDMMPSNQGTAMLNSSNCLVFTPINQIDTVITCIVACTDGKCDTTYIVIIPNIPLSYGSIGNYVWEDSNNDGLQTGETAVPGVKVYLLDATGAKLDSTTTDVSGMYLFDTLVSGTYSVQFVAPAGTKLATPYSGSDNSIDSDADLITGTSAPITINTTLPAGNIGRDNLTVDAGIVPLGSIGDLVFLDENGDGQQTSGEPGVSGMTVYLLDELGTKIDSTTTNASGNYKFDSLPGGTYSVEFKAPNGASFTTPNTGNDATDSDTGANGITDPIVLNPSIGGVNDITTIDAGLQGIQYGSIGNYVWDDTNSDGTQSSGEPAAANVKVYLLDDNGTILDSTTTDVNGLYLFDSLTDGTYKIRFDAPAGKEFTTANVGNEDLDNDVENTNGETGIITIDTSFPIGSTERDNRSIDAGLVPVPVYGKIGDLVWYDFNSNGIKDAAESGLKNAKVYLLQANVIIDSTVSDANGNYLFDSLSAGTYQVAVNKSSLPYGFGFTEAFAGTDTLVDSNADTLGFSNLIPILSLPDNSDSVNLTVDFGIHLEVWDPMGYIYCEETGEILKGGTVSIVGPPGASINVLADGSNGFYRFEGNIDGVYTLSYSHPNGYEFSVSHLPRTAITSESEIYALDGSPVDKDGLLNGLVSLGSLPNIDTTLLLDFSPSYNTYLISFYAVVGAGWPTENNFPVTCQRYGSIGDYVWLDANGDGLQSSAESPISNVKVYLLDNTGNILDTTFTDASGKYLFDSLSTGNYKIQIIPPSDKKLTETVNLLYPNINSDVNPINGISPTISIDTTLPTTNIGRNNSSVDAGLVPKCVAGVGSVSVIKQK